VGADRVKIGYSTKPWKRLNSLATSTPSELRMLWVFPGTRAEEQHCHWVFQNHRIRGEWFQLSAVVAGFRHYGFDPATFLDPRKVRDSIRSKKSIPDDPRQFTEHVGMNGRRFRKYRKMKFKKKDDQRRGGVAWSKPAYRIKLFGFDPLAKKR
jgi:Meiotically Up-regulated Gene 113 (MUG113) protein